MDLTNLSTTDVPPNSTVSRLARVLAERIDPDDEYDCEATITTTPKSSMTDHSASEIPTGGFKYLYADHGLEITVDFVDNSDCPSRRISKLVREYSDALNLNYDIAYRSSFDGAEGDFRALAFPVLDEEFRPDGTEPSWA